MKIITIDQSKQFRLIPDSALLLKHRPFFRPDYVQNLQAKIALVVKINRLGKYIQEKFASTYYDEIGFAINFYDKNCLDDLIQKGLPWERATCFDGSFALSEFVKIDDIAANIGNDVTVGVVNFRPQQSTQSQQSSQKQTFPFDLHQIPSIISELSTCMTLKIGDYIAIELGEISSAPLEINDVLQLSFNKKNVVKVVVK